MPTNPSAKETEIKLPGSGTTDAVIVKLAFGASNASCNGNALGFAESTKGVIPETVKEETP